MDEPKNNKIFYQILIFFLCLTKFICTSASEIINNSNIFNTRNVPTNTLFILPPLLATFSDSAKLKRAEVLIKATNSQFKHFYGNAKIIDGVNHYYSNKILVAGRRLRGSCDNKLIMVTRTPDEI